jgi:hypothetical protein
MKEDYPTIPQSDVSLNNKGHNRLIYDEQRYDKNKLRKEHRPLMSAIILKQKIIYDKIMARVEANRPGVFFLYGCMVTVEHVKFITV